MVLMTGLLIAHLDSAFAIPSNDGPRASGGVEPWRVRAVVDALTEGDAYHLNDLVMACRRSHAGAVVTSGFYDTRGVSRYRRVPGLHLGYDVAMPAGAAVPCAWPGTVVAVTPWTDAEWGITVRHENGSEVTYGHLRPTVSVGDRMSEGQTLGTIAIDHVDVKMRDAGGRPFDFGVDRPQPSRNQAWSRWLKARFVAAEARAHADSLRLELNALRRRLSQSSSTSTQDEMRLQAGLISRQEALRRARSTEAALHARAALQKRVAAVETALRAANGARMSTERDLREAEAKARADGLRWSDVERRVAERLAVDARLRHEVAMAGAPRRTTPMNSRAVDVGRCDALFRAGLLSRREYERATGRLPPTLESESVVGE